MPFLTKRVIVRRLQIDTALDDISPIAGFVEEMSAALGKHSRPAKFQAVYQVLEHWGDVVPLTYDMGISLTITDLDLNFEKCSDGTSYLGLGQLAAHKTAKVSTQGGEASALREGVSKWLYSTVPKGQWAQVRIRKAVPVTSLLPALWEIQPTTSLTGQLMLRKQSNQLP